MMLPCGSTGPESCHTLTRRPTLDQLPYKFEWLSAKVRYARETLIMDDQCRA